MTSVLGTRALGNRWYLLMVSFVLPSRYSLSAMLSSLPLLPWGSAEGKAGTSHPLGALPRPQDSRGSWPWGAVGRMKGGVREGEQGLKGEARFEGEAQMGGSSGMARH